MIKSMCYPIMKTLTLSAQEPDRHLAKACNSSSELGREQDHSGLLVSTVAKKQEVLVQGETLSQRNRWRVMGTSSTFSECTHTVVHTGTLTYTLTN